MPKYIVPRTIEATQITEGTQRNPTVTATAQATIEADTWPEAFAKFERDTPTISQAPNCHCRHPAAESVHGAIKDPLSGRLAGKFNPKVNH